MTAVAYDFCLTLAASERYAHCVRLHTYPEDALLAECNVSCRDASFLEQPYLQRLRRFVEEPVAPQMLQEFGRELAQRLLPAPIQNALFGRLLRAPDQTCPIRLHLHTVSGPLADLPWEFLYLDAVPPVFEPGGFLCLHPRFHLLRTVSGASSPAVEAKERLHILIAWANPAVPGFPFLPYLQDEVKSVLQAVEANGPQIKVTVLEQARPDSLRFALEDLRPDIVHLICHGDPMHGLALHGQHPQHACLLSAEQLADWLQTSPIRLVFLSACQSASIARMLARRGLPAIVAMQLPVRHAAASPLAQCFYSALTRGEPLEAALAKGRQFLAVLTPDWGVPVCYARSGPSVLFPQRSTGAYVPVELPYPRNPDFVGREALLAQMKVALHAHARHALALTGLSGQGKTQLAVEYAYTHVSDYPSGVFWLPASSTAQLQESLSALGRFFHVPECAEDRITQVRDELQRLAEPALLILDNWTRSTDLKCLPWRGACHLLATTRDAGSARSHFARLIVPGLDAQSSEHLLQSQRIAHSEELEALASIVSLLDGFPLGLALTAHHVEQLKVSFVEYRARLGQQPLEMLEAAQKGSGWARTRDEDLIASLNLSYAALSSGAALALRAAACFAAQSISPHLIHQTCGAMLQTEFEAALVEWDAHGLATQQADRRIILHPLVRAYVPNRTTPEERTLLLTRAAEALVTCLRAEEQEGYWERASQERAHCQAVVDACRMHGIQAPVEPLLVEMGIHLIRASLRGQKVAR